MLLFLPCHNFLPPPVSVHSSPLHSLARHDRIFLCCAESTSMLSRAAKSQRCEGRDASLLAEIELSVYGRTWWLGFHHACDKLAVAVWKWVNTFWGTSALKLSGAGVMHMGSQGRIEINPPLLPFSACGRACICRNMRTLVWFSLAKARLEFRSFHFCFTSISRVWRGKSC